MPEMIFCSSSAPSSDCIFMKSKMMTLVLTPGYASLISFADASVFGFLPTKIMLKPSDASSLAYAKPRPAAAPVMKAQLPSPYQAIRLRLGMTKYFTSALILFHAVTVTFNAPIPASESSASFATLS